MVTISDGLVTERYAPAELIGKLAEKIAALLKSMGGGFSPMLYGATSGASMTLIFGDPDPATVQGLLPVEFTLSEAVRVAELITLEGDELFGRALLIGPPIAQYSELAHTVQTEGVTLAWVVRDQEPRILDPDRARRQYNRLSASPKTRDRPLTVNGVLYRVITESTRDGYRGSVGLRLHEWSARPPGVSKGKRPRVIALYESKEIENQIKQGLVGESVEARLVIRQPVPGTSIDPEQYDLVLIDISEGPAEDSVLGESMIDDDRSFDDE